MLKGFALTSSLKMAALALPVLALPLASNAATLGKIGNTTVSAGGYIKLDAIYTDWSDGKNASQIHQDFFLASGTAVGNGTNDKQDFDMNARGSRLNVKTVTELDNGEKLTTFVETDFYGGGGNQVVSNSANPRLRHAFLSYGNWTFGQTWSTFMNLGAYTETLDFVGPSDGIAFVRQALVRYTNGKLQVALENPETTVAGAGATDDGGIPDLVVKYQASKALTVAAVVRQLECDNCSGTVDDSVAGYGVSISGRLPVGNDQFNYMVNAGNGIGRYAGLGVMADAWINGTELEAIQSYSGYVGYKHHWNDKWRSNAVLSVFQLADSDYELAAPTATDSTQSVHLNLLYSPVKNLTLGGELLHAKRELVNGTDGTQDRLQFSAKLAF